MKLDNLFNEISKHLLEDEKPSLYIRDLLDNNISKDNPLALIRKLKLIDQNPKYHPEGNVLNHILLVIDEASIYKKYSKNQQVFMWSALLHDIGKITTTRVRKGRITSYNHDTEGEKISLDILNKLTDDEVFKTQVSKMVRYHMQPLYFDKKLPFFEEESILRDIDYKEVALLSLCDRLGRGNMNEEDIELERSRINKFEKYFSDRE